MQVFTDTNFDFIGKKKIAYIISLTLIGLGILSLLIHLGPNYSIDFEGGTLLDLRIIHSADHPIDIGTIRDAVDDLAKGNTEIQMAKSKKLEPSEANSQYDSYTDVMIKVKGLEKADEMDNTLAEQIRSAVQKKYPKMNYEVLRQEEVGPKIGSELKGKAILAIIWAMLGIIVYIWWRFEFKFGVAAIIALFHDVLITIGIFSILNIEISLPIVAALLTIVGYSLNDTIVVFDRIRENLRLLRRRKYAEIINASINQSLSRTVITSLTTLLVVFCLLVLGGKVILPFAFALFIGVLVGTYSSIFVASPVLVEWQSYQESKNKKGNREKRSRVK